MRVVVCCKKFGAGGGAEAFLGALVRRLLQRGHSVKVLAHRVEGEVEGAEFERLRLPPVPRALRDLALARAAEKALAAERADVTFSDQKCWGAQVVRLGGGVQRVYVKRRQASYRTPAARLASRIWRALSLRERLRLDIEDRLLCHPNLEQVIANSDMVARELTAHFPHLAGRISIIYNGVDTVRFRPELRAEHRAKVRLRLGIPLGALVVVFVGHDWHRKGLATLIEALALLATRRPPIHVYGLVVGRGNRGKAENLARCLGVEERLRFAGPVPPDRFYAASDLLVLPTFYDPCANVTLEALACGLPVVTSRYNGAHEIIEEGREGLVVDDPADASALAEAIAHFADETRLAVASEAARELAERYPLEAQIDKVIEVLERTAGR